MKNDTFKKGVWYVLIGTKVLDDGSIMYVGQCTGENVLSVIAKHFEEHPHSHPVQVTEKLGVYNRVTSVERIA